MQVLVRPQILDGPRRVGPMLIVAVGIAWFLPMIAAATPTLPGVVVEDVARGTALEKAGLEPGDVLLSWVRPANPPADPEGAQGAIESVFDWTWVQIEQAPRGTVRLIGQRGGQPTVFEVLDGEWTATLRPRLADESLQQYREGKERIEAEDLEEGIESWNQVISRAEESEAWSLKCWLLLRIGDTWKRVGQWENASKAYRLALTEAQSALARVVVRRRMGHADRDRGEWERAREAYLSAREIQESTWGPSLLLASGLDDLARLESRRESLETARAYDQEALELRERLAPESLVVATSLTNVGTWAARKEQLARAEARFRDALEIHRRVSPDGSVGTASNLSNLGNVAHSRGHFDRAADYYERALEMTRKLAPQSPRLAAVYFNLGLLEIRRHNLERAAAYYRQALDMAERIFPPKHPRIADCLAGMGFVASLQEKYDIAVDFLERSLGIYRQVAPESLGAAQCLDLLGGVAHDRGDLERAEAYYQQAHEILQKTSPGGLNVAISFHELGNVAFDRGDLTLAARYHGQALEIQERLAPDSVAEANTLHDLARIHRERKQPERALALLHRALNALEAQLSRLGGSYGLQASFRAEQAESYRATIDVEIELEHSEEAFHALERSRGQSFLAQLAERDVVFAGVPEGLKDQRRRNARLYDQAQNRVASLHPKKQAKEIEALLGELQQLRWEREDLSEKILEASPQLASVRYPRALAASAAREALDPGTTLLAYSVGEEKTHLFVLGRGQSLQVFTRSVGKEELRRDVEVILQLQRPGTTPYKEPLRKAGDRLYQALIQPAEAQIGASERLLIVPDGPLHMLPFALLPRQLEEPRGRRDFEYLIEWKPLHSVLSTTVYAELKAQRRAPTSANEHGLRLAAFGDPDYRTATSTSNLAEDRSIDFDVRTAAERGFEFRSLPYSREEVTRIASLFPAGTAGAYLRAEASEERAKAIRENVRILHFATHGRYDDRTALNSLLALSLPETWSDERDNGLLQAWEILESMRLDADLVVLSACESGLGGELDGEGLIGLTRAFQIAGARSVIASLWQVNDQASAELMVRLYRHIEAGKSKDQALRAAQLELIRGPVAVTAASGQEVTRDLSLPYFWAAFQLVGDWR